jgi:hypothetical protein
VTIQVQIMEGANIMVAGNPGELRQRMLNRYMGSKKKSVTKIACIRCVEWMMQTFGPRCLSWMTTHASGFAH